jgi:hypothetical protein
MGIVNADLSFFDEEEAEPRQFFQGRQSTFFLFLTVEVLCG